MQKSIFRLLLFAVLIPVTVTLSCNISSTEQKETDEMKKLHDSATHDSTHRRSDSIKDLTHVFTNINKDVAAAFSSLINNYLELKNSLAASNQEDAQKAGKEMVKILARIAGSPLTAEQKRIYEAEQDDLVENAEHIGISKIDHQREHFSMLSQGIYTLVKYFGGGQPLYHIYCSKAGHEGAMWLSETISSGNPYSSDLKDCNQVIEKIK